MERGLFVALNGVRGRDRDGFFSSCESMQRVLAG